MVKRILAAAFILFFSFSCALGQRTTATPQQEYEQRIRKQTLHGQYIPKDLRDAMRTLDKLTSEESKEKYISQPEDFVVKRLFFSFGRWIASNWSLYEGSRFSAYLSEMGIDQPDGQKRFIMRAYHRHLSGKDLDVKDLATRYKAEKAKSDAQKKGEPVILEDLGPVPSPDTIKQGN